MKKPRYDREERKAHAVFAPTGTRVLDPDTGLVVAVVTAVPGLTLHTNVSPADFSWEASIERPKKGTAIDETPGFRTLLCADGGRRPQVFINGSWCPPYEEAKP